MATSFGQIDPGVTRTPLQQALEDEAFCFQFFQAVRLLRRVSGNKTVGEFMDNPATEVVRFNAHQSLAFPPSELHSLEVNSTRPSRMKVNFMGLTGSQGVLPLFYTEFVMERLSKKDGALADFLDIFNHRIISLFYLAWQKHHFPVSFENGEADRLSRMLATLIGIGTDGLQNRLEPEISDKSLFYYTGLLAQRPHSAVALEQALGDHFGVPVAVEQFVGAWYRLDAENQTSFKGSGGHEALGLGAVVGDEIWDGQSLVRIRLGPLGLDRYRDFLPGAPGYKALQALVQFYASELDFEMQLVLKAEETPGLELGCESAKSPQLGWVTWVRSAPMQRNPGDTIIRL